MCYSSARVQIRDVCKDLSLTPDQSAEFAMFVCAFAVACVCCGGASAPITPVVNALMITRLSFYRFTTPRDGPSSYTN